VKQAYGAVALASLLLAGLAASEPSTKTAWTPEQLRFVASGDAARGKAIAETCQVCHGAAPENAATPFPYLDGQLATYIFRQLRDYKDGSRVNEVMAGLVADLSDQDLADVAAWYANQAPARAHKAQADEGMAERLAQGGDPQRTIAPCAVCHVSDARGQKIDVPALAGQKADYLEQTLLAYRDGLRRNDLYQRMRHIARQLNTDEIRELALYYSALGE
jgi:cytochrome c553